MGKNKRTPKQQMKYWRVKGQLIRARTARVAIRKYIRGSLDTQILIRELELDNPFGGDEMPSEAAKQWKKLLQRARPQWQRRLFAVPVNKRGQ